MLDGRKKYIFIYFSCLLFALQLSGQTNQVVDEIEFQGIKKLNLEFLEKLIITKVGDIIDLKILEADEAQLRRLSAVSTTNRQIIPNEKNNHRVKVVFEITERRTWLPLIGVGGIKDNFWFLLGLSEFNVAGKNQTLSTQFLLNDGLANFQIYYQNRRIRGGKWGFSAELKRVASSKMVDQCKI